jgi:hypothetical protein
MRSGHVHFATDTISFGMIAMRFPIHERRSGWLNAVRVNVMDHRHVHEKTPFENGMSGTTYNIMIPYKEDPWLDRSERIAQPLTMNTQLIAQAAKSVIRCNRKTI